MINFDILADGVDMNNITHYKFILQPSTIISHFRCIVFIRIQLSIVGKNIATTTKLLYVVESVKSMSVEKRRARVS